MDHILDGYDKCLCDLPTTTTTTTTKTNNVLTNNIFNDAQKKGSHLLF